MAFDVCGGAGGEAAEMDPVLARFDWWVSIVQDSYIRTGEVPVSGKKIARTLCTCFARRIAGW